MVEIIPKKKQKREIPSRFNNVLFGLFFFVFLFSLLLFFVFRFQASKYESQIKEISAQLQSQKQAPEFKSLEQKMILYQNKFNNISEILSLYSLPSKVFSDLINKTIQPEVILNSLNLHEKTDKEGIYLELHGYAPNKEILAQQIKAYELLPEIKDVYFESAKIGKEGNLEFALSLIISSNYLTLSK